MRDNDIAQIDVKVVDLQGRWRRMTYSAANVTEALHELKQQASLFKILGSYPKATL